MALLRLPPLEPVDELGQVRRLLRIANDKLVLQQLLRCGSLQRGRQRSLTPPRRRCLPQNPTAVLPRGQGPASVPGSLKDKSLYSRLGRWTELGEGVTLVSSPGSISQSKRPHHTPVRDPEGCLGEPPLGLQGRREKTSMSSSQETVCLCPG